MPAAVLALAEPAPLVLALAAGHVVAAVVLPAHWFALRTQFYFFSFAELGELFWEGFFAGQFLVEFARTERTDGRWALLAGYFELVRVFHLADVLAFRTENLFLILIYQSLFNNRLEFLKQANFNVILYNLLFELEPAVWTCQILNSILSNIDFQVHLKAV